MNWFSSFLVLLFGSIIFIIIQQSSSLILANHEEKIKQDRRSLLIDTISAITDKTSETVDELKCPKGWPQIRHSCYLLSQYYSTAAQANDTCNLRHLNNSYLMYVKHPVELFYAAYTLTKNNLTQLLIEIDQDLVKNGRIVHMLSPDDDVQWKEFSADIFGKNFNERSSENRQSVTEFEPKIEEKLNNNLKDHNQLLSIDEIRNACHQLKWNVVNEDVNILLLTVELHESESICSLNNIDFTVAYFHLCQYVLDRCQNNILCGKHGRCFNSQTGFNCSCSFLYDGLFCDKFSTKDINIIAAVPVLIISFLWLNSTTRNFFWNAIQRLKKRFRRQQTTSSQTSNDGSAIQFPTLEHGHEDTQSQQSSIRHTADRHAHTSPVLFELSSEEKHLRFVLVFILSVFFSLILIGTVSIIHYLKLIQMRNMTNNHINTEYRSNTIFRIDNLIFFVVSMFLIVLFSYWNTQDRTNGIRHFGLIEPINPFYITDRYKTAAVVTIQMFEILEVLDETLIDIRQSSQSGIFFQIFIRMCFIIINACRYYPIMASFLFQDIRIRFLTLSYVISIISHIFYQESFRIYRIPFLDNQISSNEQTNSLLNMNWWPFVYSCVRNSLRYILIGYICAELIMRVFYDSIYIAQKNGRKIFDIPVRKVDQYSFVADYERKCFVRKINSPPTNGSNNNNNTENENGYWHSFRTYLNKIYKYENDFRLTTIVICAYTIAFIFLFHLTFNLIFLYTTEKTSYIDYLKHVLERILNIPIKDRSFGGEVLASAFLTMSIFGIQLLNSIQNYKDSVRQLYIIYTPDPEAASTLKKQDIIPKSAQYPAFILRYLLGGFVICFNLILLLLTGLNLILSQIISFKLTILSIVSTLFLYWLHKIINQTVNALVNRYDPPDENSPKLNRLYSILLYFNFISASYIGIISSIIRLIASVIVNIFYMPRVDYTCFVQPLQSQDAAHMAFEAFIRLEILCTYPLLLQFSTSVQPVSNTNVILNETNAEEHGQDEYHDPENNDEVEADAQSVNEVIYDTNHTAVSSSLEYIPLQVHRSARANQSVSHHMRSREDDDFETRLLPPEVLSIQV